MLCRIKIGIKPTYPKSKFNFVIVKIFKLTRSPCAIEDGHLCLQTTHSKKSWRVAGQIYKLPGSCFHSENGQITSLALKIERKNITRCLGGLRMEDQGERSPQTFHVNIFSFPQPRRKQGDRWAFTRVLNTDSGFKAAAWT